MKILISAAEVAPFAKVGGLADVTSALPKSWQSMGHECLIVLPRYGNMEPTDVLFEQSLPPITVPMGSWNEYCTVQIGTLPNSNVKVALVESAEYYGRSGIYGYHEGFLDNDRRFIFLCRATFEVARALNFSPDVLHAHDYHTALTMPMLKILYASDPLFAQCAAVFTIHNMAYQGIFEPLRALELSGFAPAEFYPGSWFEHNGTLNALKSGIMFADKVTTVSPTYAREICWTPEGMGLQEALRSRANDLVGILNGIDSDVWSPSIDKNIHTTYDVSSIDRKELNKRALLRDLGLSPVERERSIPLVGMVSRLTEQKGIALLAGALEPILDAGLMRLVVLGSGEQRFEAYLEELAHRYPGKAFFVKGYNPPFSHLVQAGSDFYIMPSKFEPCGLTQLYAMAYGAVPIVRAIGGLADSVQQYDPITFTGAGFIFTDFSSQGFHGAISNALRIYRVEPHWSKVRLNCLQADHDIDRCARQYLEVFSSIT